MPKWVEWFQNHPVHQQLQNFHAVLSNIDKNLGVAKTEPSPDVTESVERLKQIGNQTGKVLSAIDPFLAPVGVLDNINNYLSQAIAYCNQYQADSNPTQLDNANNQAEAVIIQLGSLPFPRSPEELQGFSESISSFRRSVGQYQRYVTDEHEGIQTQIEAAKQELAGLSNNISAQQSRIDEVVNDLQRQFSDSEERRRVEFTNSTKDYDTKFKEAQQGRNSAFHEHIDGQSAQAKVHLDNILQSKQMAEQLVHVIGNTGMVGGYQKIADDERRVAFRWNIAAALAFLLLIGFAIYAFVATLGTDVSWQTFGARLFVAVTFGIFAAFSAKQAINHEVVERRSRRLELALASIDPYLVSLPEGTQHEVKKQLAIKFFGEVPEAGQNTDETNGHSADLLRMTIETVNELAKKAPGPS